MKYVNIKEVSIWLTGGSQAIRRDKTPAKYIDALNDIKEFWESWEKKYPKQGKGIIEQIKNKIVVDTIIEAPEELKEMVSRILTTPVKAPDPEVIAKLKSIAQPTKTIDKNEDGSFQPTKEEIDGNYLLVKHYNGYIMYDGSTGIYRVEKKGTKGYKYFTDKAKAIIYFNS